MAKARTSSAGVGGGNASLPRVKAPPVEMPAGAPAMVVRGRGNPEFFRYVIAQANTMMLKVSSGELDGMPKGLTPKELSAWAKDQARYFGIDPEHVGDARSDEQVAEDVLRAVLDAPMSILEQTDRGLSALERIMDDADKGCERSLKRLMMSGAGPGGGGAEAEAEEAVERLGKVRGLIRRAIRLRDRARNPVPGGMPTRTKMQYHGVSAAHLLRQVAYIQRRNMDLVKDDPAGNLVIYGELHYQLSTVIWLAENSVLLRGGLTEDECEVVVGGQPCHGVAVVAPPGHGKTFLTTGWVRRRLATRPRTQGVWLHAKEEKASQNLVAIKEGMRPTSAEGRRFLAVYPDVRLDRKSDNSTSLRLADAEGHLRDPNLSAAGVMSKGLGIDNDFQVLDDVTDMDDVHEESTRRKKIDYAQATWFSRMRGDDWFRLQIGTLWHHQDLQSMVIAQVRKGKSDFRVSIHRTGGPDSAPKFRPVWPEVYSRKVLEEKFYRDYNGNRWLWSANYMGDPRPESLQPVKKLRLWPADIAEEGEHWVAAGVGHLSFDPCATVGRKSDKAGMVYGVVANVPTERVETGEGGQRYVVHDVEKRLRIMLARRLSATQTEQVAVGAELALRYPISYVHVETVGGFVGSAEMWQVQHGVTPIRHTTRNKNKGQRLAMCATHLEDGNPGVRAVVEFPGLAARDEHGNPRLTADGSYIVKKDPEYEWLYDQILNFGACDQDDALDSVTQMVNHLSGDLAPGRGVVSERVRAFGGENSRHAAEMKRIYERLGRSRDEDDDEAGWMRERWA